MMIVFSHLKTTRRLMMIVFSHLKTTRRLMMIVFSHLKTTRLRPLPWTRSHPGKHPGKRSTTTVAPPARVSAHSSGALFAQAQA
jgi:hypothetical protein